MYWCAVHLFAMPLDSGELLLERSASSSESIHFLLVDSVTSVKLGVVSPRGGIVPSSFIRVSEIAFSTFLPSLSNLVISVVATWAISSLV
jgi:hypothetical protein